ncbi:MAG: hypothetical protein ABIR19_06115, partial [Ginsengibacter sp.]
MKYLHSEFFFSILFFLGCHSNNQPGEKDPVIIDVSGQSAKVASTTAADEADYQYDLASSSHSWKLPEQLIEVSGNTWVDKDHLILIEDLNPNLYLIKIDGDKAILEKTIPFTNTEKDKLDIEDVTIVDNVVYALWSHGSLFKIKDWNSPNPQTEKIKTFLKKENNTEGLCYDPTSNKLLLACKEDPGIKDADKSTRAVYDFDVSSNILNKKPYFLIREKDFSKITSKDPEFNPSAIAVHPVTHDIYLLSTRDTKCMAVYSHDGSTLKS